MWIIVGYNLCKVAKTAGCRKLYTTSRHSVCIVLLFLNNLTKGRTFPPHIRSTRDYAVTCCAIATLSLPSFMEGKLTLFCRKVTTSSKHG